MADCMTFPNTFDEFAEQYKIVDKKEVYTNGTELIPIFRVKQWLDHTRADTVRKMQERVKAKIHKSVHQYWNENDGGYYLAEDVDDDIDQIAEEIIADGKQ